MNIQLPSSKSISNRLLIMQALAETKFEILNLSKADDTKILEKALQSNTKILDLGMAGTAFRFMTAYCSIQNETRILTGHERMKERPIAPLVNALRSIGSEIIFLEKQGFPPLEIKGNRLLFKKVQIEANLSSQYVSALLMIAPYCIGGLEIEIEGELVSEPYVEMTLSLMSKLSIQIKRNGNIIKIQEGKYKSESNVTVESDWSSAAFFYQYFACSNLNLMQIDNLKFDSIQGDRILSLLFEQMGVKTTQTSLGVELSKIKNTNNVLKLDLIDTPDLIPSIAIAAALLKKTCIIHGVKTLRIKESNRVEALKNELAKINVSLIELDENIIQITKVGNLPKKVSFNTYNDHRIAMAFAMLKGLIPIVVIDNEEVVCKSFPNFWIELEKLNH